MRHELRHGLLAATVLMGGTTVLSSEALLTKAAECVRLIDRNNSDHADPWVMFGHELCLVSNRLERYNLTATTRDTLGTTGISPEYIKLVDDLITPIKPYSANPHLSAANIELALSVPSPKSLLSGAERQGVPILSVSEDPFRVIDGYKDLPHYYKWLTFHETAHTIGVDLVFRLGWEEFDRAARPELRTFQPDRKFSGDHGSLDAYDACPDGYESSLYGLFDESTYVQTMSCTMGHPYDGSHEFEASSISVFHLFPDDFISRYEVLNDRDKKVAKTGVSMTLNYLRRINPDDTAFNALIPAAIQKLVLG